MSKSEAESSEAFSSKQLFKIVLNASGPLGLAATLLGWIKPVIGILWAIFGFAYIAWELWPFCRTWALKKGPRMALFTFVIVGAVAGALAGFGFWTVIKKQSQSAETQKAITAPPTLPVPTQPTLSSLFKADFPNVMKASDDGTSITWDDGMRVPYKRQLYLDFDAKTEFVGFYIPSSGSMSGAKTFRACMVLSDGAQRALDEITNKAHATGGYGDQMTSIKDLTFSGRVLIYHEDVLSITQKAEIIQAFSAKHFDVQFRGPDYLALQLIAWHQQYDSH